MLGRLDAGIRELIPPHNLMTMACLRFSDDPCLTKTACWNISRVLRQSQATERPPYRPHDAHPADLAQEPPLACGGSW